MSETPRLIQAFIEELRAGVSSAQRRLLREYWDVPYGRALRILGHRGDAHDVAMGVLGSFMVTHVHTFRAATEPALRLYLATVATRHALAQRERSLTLLSESEPDAAAAESPEQRDVWLLARLERCLRGLPARSRLILRLRYGQGFDNAEVAEVLGQTRANVSKLLAHPQKGLLARLRRCILRTRETNA